MDTLLQQGIAAAKASDKEKAFQLLMRAAQDGATAEQAWLWLSSVVEHDSERLFCLENVLRRNPNHSAAQRGAAMLRQKGIFPAPPSAPIVQQPSTLSSVAPIPYRSLDQTLRQSEARAPAPSHTDVSSAQVSNPVPLDTTSSPIAPATSTESSPDIQAFYQLVAAELAKNTAPSVIEKALIARNIPRDVARAIIETTQRAIRKARAEKHRRRMIRGLLLTIVGSIITCLTYVFASDLGGRYVLCYGAIIFGIIDFVVGLIGWLSGR